MRIPIISKYIDIRYKFEKENHCLKMALTECLNIIDPDQLMIIGKALKEYNVLDAKTSKFIDSLLLGKEKRILAEARRKKLHKHIE